MALVSNNGEFYFITVENNVVHRKKLNHPPDTKYYNDGGTLYYTKLIDGVYWIMKNDEKCKNTGISSLTPIDSFCIAPGKTRAYISFSNYIRVCGDCDFDIQLRIENINNDVISMCQSKHDCTLFIYYHGIIYSYKHNKLEKYKTLTDVKYFISLKPHIIPHKLCYTYINNNNIIKQNNKQLMYRLYNVRQIDKDVISQGNEDLIQLKKRIEYVDFDNGELFWCDGLYGILNSKVYKLSNIDSYEYVGKHIHQDGIYLNPDLRYWPIENNLVRLIKNEIIVM